MDITISGSDALQRAAECCRSIFGEKTDGGPARLSIPVLEQIKADWPSHPDDLITVGLEPPPGAPINGFKIRMHRLQVVCGGRLIGHALRMDAANLGYLRAYERAWATFRASTR